MFAKSLVVLSIGLLVAVQSQVVFDAGNANGMVDGIIKLVKTKYNTTLDPFQIPDMHLEFDKKIALSTWHGDIVTSQGVINGLNAIHRSGDCELGTEEGHFTMHLQFGDSNIKAHLHAVTKIGIKHLSPIHSTVNIDADVGEIDIKAIVALDENQKPILKSLDVDELKNTKIHISGLNIFTPLANLVADIFVKDFNSKARELLDGLLKDVLGKEIANIKGLPIG